MVMGKSNVGSAVAQIPHAPTDEDLVHNVVQRVDQQGDHTGDGEPYDQPTDGFGGKGTLFFGNCIFHGQIFLL